MSVYIQVSKAESYRRYADELRAIAEALKSVETRQVLLGVANDFYQMATAAEDTARAKSAPHGEARPIP
jgi:hypothetical protein